LPVAGTSSGESDRARRWCVALALFAIVALGAVLRRWGWESWSYWLDESLQLFVASHPARQILALLRNERNHPPLDFFLTHLGLKISASPLVLRWLPAFFSLATLPLAFLRCGGARRSFAALGAALTLAVVPIAVHQGQELRAYAQAFFWVALADVARTQHAESGGKRTLLLQIGASVAAVYSLYISLFALAATWLGDGLLGWKTTKSRWRLLAVPAVTALAFAPWVLAVRTNLTRANEIAAPKLSLRLVETFAVGLVADRQPDTRYAAGAIAIWALALFGASRSADRERARSLIEISTIVALTTAFLLVTNHWFEIRYFFFALWPLSRLVGEGLASVASLAPRRQTAVFAFAAIALVAAELPGLVENSRWGRPDWRLPARYLAFQTRSGCGGPVIPADWWSFMLLNAQRMNDELTLPLEDPRLTADALRRGMESARGGWISRAEFGGSEADSFLETQSLPWARFERADNVKLYRFENGAIVPP